MITMEIIQNFPPNLCIFIKLVGNIHVTYTALSAILAVMETNTDQLSKCCDLSQAVVSHLI